MKKTFLAKRNILLSSSGVSWGAIAIAFAVIVLLMRIIAPNFFWHVATPIFRSADALAGKSHSFLNSFGDIAKLASQNEQLKEENTALASENQILSKKIENISDLKNISDGVLAGVIVRPPESPYDTLVISAGKNESIAVGQKVFGIGGVPIGIISSVLDDFSRVTLFSAPGTNTNGWIGRDSLPLTLSGAGAGTLNAVIARSAEIAVGDIVFAPGPGMLPIGTVVRIDSDLSSPSVTLRIQPTINIFSITWVVVRNTGL